MKDIRKDIQAVCSLLNISVTTLAKELGCARSTLIRVMEGKSEPSGLFVEQFYSYCLNNNHRELHLNQIKCHLYEDEYGQILYHGSRTGISSPISFTHSREKIDFGQGFYLGETYLQAATYIANSVSPNIYLYSLDKTSHLKIVHLDVSLEWIIAVCYYRKHLERFKAHQKLKEIISSVEEADVVVAPIADNNMYEILSMFSRGEITDLQAMYALSTSNLGKQYVIKTKKAINSLRLVDELYLCRLEKTFLQNERNLRYGDSIDKSRLAIEKYRRQGKYIEEILC